MANFYDELHVFGCDLFLLEHWDAASSLSDDAQMMQIFAQFVELPIAQRLVYIRRARQLHYASSLPKADQDLLYRVRPYDERILCRSEGAVCLRTYYGPGSDEALREFLAEDDIGDNCDLWVLSDPARYNFGNNWERIFHRMPQLLDVTPKYESRARQARDKAVRDARHNRAVLERDGHWPPPNDDGSTIAKIYDSWLMALQVTSKKVLYAGWHMAREVGYINVLDEKTLGAHWQDSDDDEGEGGEGGEIVEGGKGSEGGEDGKGDNGEGTATREEKSDSSKRYAARRFNPESTGRMVLCGWFDAHGTLLRWNRLTREDISEFNGLLHGGYWIDREHWLDANMDGDLPDPGFDTNPVSDADLEVVSDPDDGRMWYNEDDWL